MTLKQTYNALVSFGITVGMRMPDDYLDSDEKEMHFAALAEALKLIESEIEKEKETSDDE